MSSPLEDKSLAALERALGAAPAYAAWRRSDPGPTADTDARYAALPALTKRELRRDFPEGFVPSGVDLEALLARGDVSYVETAGTTGDAVTLLWHQGFWDASERASWQLNAHARRLMTGTHREAVLASARCVGPAPRRQRRTLAERTLGRLLFLNEGADVAAWSDDDIRRMVGELAEYRPAVLEADPVYLAAFSRRAAALGLSPWQPELIVFTYAYATNAHRRQVRKCFGAPTMSSHGSTECGYVFIECARGRLHQNTASCRVDVVPLKPEAGGPHLARFLVTPFGHPVFVVLRFDIGDLGLVSRTPCPCGNDVGVTLDALAGRAKDATFATDGRLVTARALDDALQTAEGLADYQLHQTEAATYRLSIVSDSPRADAQEATRRLAALYGAGARISVEPVDGLLPEPSGKYRLCRAHREAEPRALSARPPPEAPERERSPSTLA